MNITYLDIPPDTDDTQVDTSTGQRADLGDVGDDGGTSTATWLLLALVAVIIAAAIIAVVMRRQRTA
jgi:hypothetical protein